MEFSDEENTYVKPNKVQLAIFGKKPRPKTALSLLAQEDNKENQPTHENACKPPIKKCREVDTGSDLFSSLDEMDQHTAQEDESSTSLPNNQEGIMEKERKSKPSTSKGVLDGNLLGKAKVVVGKYDGKVQKYTQAKGGKKFLPKKGILQIGRAHV